MGLQDKTKLVYSLTSGFISFILFLMRNIHFIAIKLRHKKLYIHKLNDCVLEQITAHTMVQNRKLLTKAHTYKNTKQDKSKLRVHTYKMNFHH